jgi:hypothetical protein
VNKQEGVVADINADKDLPEGLGIDVWNKLVEVRNRKIAIEREVTFYFFTPKHASDVAL